MGSLFSGAGGFELAASMNGIIPVWNSEIEPNAVKVTDTRFPHTRQYGDICNIHGGDLPAVDVITFGSPCQDISIAGLKAGIIDGDRSCLFFEAIRIIEEMRAATNNTKPRFIVWENVKNALHNRKGDDFHAVLQHICAIKDPDAVVPRPDKGWSNAGCIVGDDYSVAWRLYDAQYWGVAQRRQRVYLIGDLGSRRAGEILLKPEGMPGHCQPGESTGEGTAADAEGSSYGGNQWRV